MTALGHAFSTSAVSPRLQACKLYVSPAGRLFSCRNAPLSACSSSLWSSSSSSGLRSHKESTAKAWCGLSRLNEADMLRSKARAAQVEEAMRSSLQVESRKRSEVGSMVVLTAVEEAAVYHSRTFQDTTTEEELLLGINKEVQSMRIPPHIGMRMKELYQNYRDAVLEGGPGGLELVVHVMAMVLDRILLQFEDPFTFPSYHERMRRPFDYYKFGQDYIRPLVNFHNSFLGNKLYFDEIEHRLEKGHNVVLLSNHQTEADPAVIALLLEKTHPYLAENLIYTAGDRVVLDPFCKPFSMGRNLLCVYSKKHIQDVPELVEMKRKANTRTLKEMTLLLRKGGQLIWIAPSGGRDRSSRTGNWSPAAFDSSVVAKIKRLVMHSHVQGHIYPLAILCHNVMPPPNEVQKEIGERRLFGYTGVGLSIGRELEAGVSSIAAEDFTKMAWNAVSEQYSVLESAVHGGEGLNANTISTVLCQPWRDGPPFLP